MHRLQFCVYVFSFVRMAVFVLVVVEREFVVLYCHCEGHGSAAVVGQIQGVAIDFPLASVAEVRAYQCAVVPVVFPELHRVVAVAIQRRDEVLVFFVVHVAVGGPELPCAYNLGPVFFFVVLAGRETDAAEDSQHAEKECEKFCVFHLLIIINCF